MRILRAFWLLAIAVGLLAGAAPADDVEMADGRTIRDVLVESYAAGVFQARILTDGVVSEQLYPLEAERLTRIDFRSTDRESPGQPARVAMADGTVRDGAIVEAAQQALGGLEFVLRPANSAPGNPTYAVAAERIARIDFPSAVPPASTPTPTPVPTPTATAVTPGPDPFPPARPAATPEDADDAWDDEEEGSFEAPGMLANFGVAALGVGAVVLGVILNLLIVSLVGGLVLHFVAKINNVTDFPYWKAVVTALVLAIIPPVAGALAICIPIPLVNLAVALIIYLFVARIIIMAAMEVLEGQAWTILLTYIVFTIALWCLIGKGLELLAG